MNVEVTNPTKVVTDHTFAFTDNSSFLISTEAGEKVKEAAQYFDLTLRVTVPDGTVTMQFTRLYKHNLKYHNRVERIVTIYPEGHSPVELAIKEQNERNQRRIAHRRTPPREGAY